MFGKTDTYKVIYWDSTVMSGDKRRSTFYEAYDRNDAIYRFQQDYGNNVIVRECVKVFG